MHVLKLICHWILFVQQHCTKEATYQWWYQAALLLFSMRKVSTNCVFIFRNYIISNNILMFLKKHSACGKLNDPWAITVYTKKYAHGFCFAVLCCGYTLTDFPISIRLTSLALWQSNDCPSASKATLMNMDKYFMWIHYERLHNHNKAKHNKTVCIFLGIYCTSASIDSKH